MNDGPSRRHRAILDALLAYRQSPGKYSQIGQQPALLFASITEVLQLASGRSPQGLKTDGPSAAVQQAAGFFIRTALLHPGADHYALLGLQRDAENAAVKDRYRLMMRLMHPDFAGSPVGEKWPVDAATRVNRAYEVLSSPVQRRNYDDRLDASSPRETSTEARPIRAIKPGPAPSPNGNAHQLLKWLAAGFGAAGMLAFVAALWAGLSGETEMLVQRDVPRKAKSVIAIAQSSDNSPASAVTTPPTGGSSADAANSTASSWFSQFPRLSKPDFIAQVESKFSSSAPAEPKVAAVKSPPVAVPALERAPADVIRAAPSLEPPPEVVAARPAPASAAPPAPSDIQPRPAPAVVALAPPVATPPPVAPRKAIPKGLTLAEVHPLLAKMLEHMESGSGDRVIDLLERDARGGAAAQAWLQDYNAATDGARSVKLSHVQLKAEPREGRLRVTGQVLMEMRNQPAGTPAKPFSVQAEFASREGTVVLTGLARAQDN